MTILGYPTINAQPLTGNPSSDTTLCNNCLDALWTTDYFGLGVIVTINVANSAGTLERHSWLCLTCARNLAAMITAQVNYVTDAAERRKI